MFNFGKQGNGDNVPNKTLVNDENVENKKIVPSDIGFLTSNDTVITAEESTVASEGGGLMTSSDFVREMSANISAKAEERHQKLKSNKKKMLNEDETESEEVWSMEELVNKVKEWQLEILKAIANMDVMKIDEVKEMLLKIMLSPILRRLLLRN